MKRTRRSRKGFTLIEILLVLTLIGLMAGMAVYAVVGARLPAQKKICEGTLEQVSSAIEEYGFAIGHYPTSDEGGLAALLTKPGYPSEETAAKWRQFLKKEPTDPWGNLIKYEPSAAGTSDSTAPAFKLWSVGPDGQDGTEDDIVFGVVAGSTPK
jgi:general secretion pathway protein G